MSATASENDLLACGRAVDDLLEQVADRLPPADADHQGGCVHCRATLAELTALWQPVHAAAAQRVTAPAGLLDQVMERVRDLAANAWYGILDGDRGVTRIAAWVIAAIARLAAGRVPGVSYVVGRAGGRTGTGAQPEPGAGVGVAGRRAVIDLQLVAELGPALPALAEAVRGQVRSEVAGLTGLDVVEVNIAFTDLNLDLDGDENGSAAAGEAPDAG